MSSYCSNEYPNTRTVRLRVVGTSAPRCVNSYIRDLPKDVVASLHSAIKQVPVDLTESLDGDVDV